MEFFDMLGKLERGQSEPEDTAHFHVTVREAVLMLDVSCHELAREFGCTQGVVRGWLDGTLAPHPKMRPHVYGYLLTRLFA